MDSVLCIIKTTIIVAVNIPLAKLNQNKANKTVYAYADALPPPKH